jgi:hypothetical protein
MQMGKYNMKRNMKIITLICAFIIPGSGHVILGKPGRGLLFVAWILFFGFITYQITSKNISLVGRFSGGLAIWVFSILEVVRLLKKRNGV